VLNNEKVVFLLDVDNTLLDNDRFAADLSARLEQAFGASECARYWAIFGRLREQLGLADYLGSLQAFRVGLDDHPDLLAMSEFLLEYPFSARLFPRALEAVAHLGTVGRAVVLSDGDIIFQPRKIQRSGIWDAVEGRVMIYVHKERVLDHMQQRYPAAHYVKVANSDLNFVAESARLVRRNKFVPEQFQRSPKGTTRSPRSPIAWIPRRT